MTQGFFQEHWLDGNRPTGGVTTGKGFTISWQNGPLGRGEDRKESNGAFVEDIIQAVIGRLEFYQGSPFKSVANENAIEMLKTAGLALDARTKEREERGVEGTHEV